MLLRKLSLFVLAFFIMIIPFFSFSAQAASPVLIINGKQITGELSPILINGRFLVSVRVVSEELGAEVSWNNQTSTVKITGEGKTILIPINKTQVTVNGKTYTVDVPAQIYKNRTFMPVRFLAENLGAEVEWSDSNNTAIITKGDHEAGTSVQVNSIEQSGYGRNETFTVKATGPMQAKTMQLKNPDRFVVDISNAVPNLGNSNMTPNSDVVASIRTAQFSINPNVTRLVFDLKQPARGKVTADTANHQLKVTFTPLLTGSDKSDGPLAGKIIVVDPGHGGYDPGAAGVNGNVEKDLNLQVATQLEDLLRSAGAKVIATRTDDSFVVLQQRPAIANDAGADLFISIHHNSAGDSISNGVETFYYTTNPNSKQLAQAIQTEMAKQLGLLNRGAKQRNLCVIREAKMPSVLVEVAFLSNPTEDTLAGDPAFQAKAAAAIYQGIIDYLGA